MTLQSLKNGMRTLAVVAAMVALAGPVEAAEDWTSITMDISDFRGNQPASFPMAQIVTLTTDGAAKVTHWSLFHDEGFRGEATPEQIRQVDELVKKLQRYNIPSSYGEHHNMTVTIEGESGTLLDTKGLVKTIARRSRTLDKLRLVLLDIAERAVNPPRLPDDVYEGRIEASWGGAEITIYSRTYKIEPESWATKLAALDGVRVTVRGDKSWTRSWWGSGSGTFTVKELISPKLGTLEGEVKERGEDLVLKTADGEVELSGEMADMIRDLELKTIAVEGFIEQGARGVKSVRLRGVKARMTDDDWPMEEGDEVLVTEKISWGSSVRVVRADGRETSVRTSRLSFKPTTVTSGGLGGNLTGE